MCIKSTPSDVGTFGEFGDGDVFDRMFFLNELGKSLTDKLASFLRSIVGVVDLHVFIIT